MCQLARKQKSTKSHKKGYKKPLETIAKELRRQILIEARNTLTRGGDPDYKAVFDCFDMNGNGSLNLNEVRGYC
jgi:hypothetical protein